MALLIGAAMLTSVFAQSIEPSDDTLSAAAEASVDVIDLMGAMSTTGLDARPYLIGVGELAPPVPVYSVWDSIAACEAGGNWAANTGNGYYGGLQFDLYSWRAAGGTGFPHQASRATQIAVGQRWLALTSWNSWPVCSRRLGLR